MLYMSPLREENHSLSQPKNITRRKELDKFDAYREINIFEDMDMPIHGRDTDWKDMLGGSSPMSWSDLPDHLRRHLKTREFNGPKPETAGTDMYFIHNFVTPDMELDFERIEADFLKHCYTRLREFAEVQWYAYEEAKFSSPEVSHQHLIVGLMLNGTRTGDEYCMALIRYLFKTYHKPLYRQLKRFKSLTGDEVLSLCLHEGELDLGHVAIILTMCVIDQIPVADSCGFFYEYMDDLRKDREKRCEEKSEFEVLDGDLFKECEALAEQWCDAETENGRNIFKWYKSWQNEDKFVKVCLKDQGYPEDYVLRSAGTFLGYAVEFGRTLAILRTAFPKKDFSFEEVQRYAHLYSAISALIHVSEELDEVNKNLLGLYENADWYEETLFHPENILIPKHREPETNTASALASVHTKAKTEDGQPPADTEDLKAMLARKTTELKSLRLQYASAMRARKEAEAILEKAQADRQELIALREFVYNMEHSIPEPDQLSTERMKEAISSKRYVIIGGHVNWINKLRAEFPGWTYIPLTSYNTADPSVLDNKDMIFFFTDYISHTAYTKFIHIARDRKMKFSYLHGVNMDQVIKQIYQNGV